MPKKLPYGISDFAKLIERNCAYVDKSRFIRLLEDENNPYQFFLRPRRFGKSLFLSMLESYYDLNQKDRFESLFGGLDIGREPTPEQGRYAILRFDFSGLDTNNHDEFRAIFKSRIEECAKTFFENYKNIFTDAAVELQDIHDNKPGLGTLDIVYRVARSARVRIFVIIDEYDHFANNLIAMGKNYNDEVKAGGIVRTFYEILKIGTASVISRIFITGVSPLMLSNLTSGFNMSTNYSLIPKYNEMFGFTREEVEWLIRETGVDKSLIKVDMEAYYNGYMFCDEGENKVYNSQMVLYLFNQILLFGKQPKHIIDGNLRVDYDRLRRLAGNKDSWEILLRIANDGSIYGDVHEFFSLDYLNSGKYFLSLLFYLGMLSNGGFIMGQTHLKIPNYSIKTLYWEYVVSCILDLEKEMECALKLTETIKEMALKGNITPYLDFFTENFLKRLSNRDLINFDEKYIKVMMLASLFVSRLYLPVSEDENINGYTDIYLLKHPAIPDIKFEYIFEIKHAKTDATESDIKTKFEEAQAQIEKYKKDERFAGRDDVKFAVIVFKGKGGYEALEC